MAALKTIDILIHAAHVYTIWFVTDMKSKAVL